jgi:type II secretory pathway component GspD/PulD (secretin)
LKFDFCRCAGQGSPVAIARIEHALRGPLHANGLDFVDTPLEEIVNVLQDEYGIPIKIKVSALEAEGLDSSEPVTVNLHQISLRSALRLMLEALQLTFTVRDEVVEITSNSDADSHLVACVYNVRPFIGDTSDASMKALVDTITSCVEAETWAENGDGNAAIRSLRPGLLVISQTQHTHDEIASLLNAIQKMREKSAAGD